MKLITKNLTNEWKSTLVGLIILVFAAIMALIGRIPWEGFLGAVPIAVGLMAIKDKHIGLGTNDKPETDENISERN